jgi:hypothetical protein
LLAFARVPVLNIRERSRRTERIHQEYGLTNGHRDGYFVSGADGRGECLGRGLSGLALVTVVQSRFPHRAFFAMLRSAQGLWSLVHEEPEIRRAVFPARHPSGPPSEPVPSGHV